MVTNYINCLHTQSKKTTNTWKMVITILYIDMFVYMCIDLRDIPLIFAIIMVE